MLDLIEHLQRKPEYVRRRILWITTIAVTVVIAGIWAGTLYLRAPIAPASSLRYSPDIAPFSSVVENISGLLSSGALENALPPF